MKQLVLNFFEFSLMISCWNLRKTSNFHWKNEFDDISCGVRVQFIYRLAAESRFFQVFEDGQKSNLWNFNNWLASFGSVGSLDIAKCVNR